MCDLRQNLRLVEHSRWPVKVNAVPASERLMKPFDGKSVLGGSGRDRHVGIAVWKRAAAGMTGW